jgi:pimeloyl-ACP methyl ester carboxylesterase
VITNRQPGARTGLEYRTYVPSRVRSAHAVVLVHGASRGAARQFREFLPAAIQHGFPLIAPTFSAVAFPGYQRLAGADGPMAAANAFRLMLSDIATEFGLDTAQVDLVGFSGGAQFAHRFAMVDPGRVRRMVLASSGWFTLLDPARPFPEGIATSSTLHTATVDVDRFLRVPMHLLVGERDVGRDQKLRSNGSLDRRQGRHRLARALHWIDHLEAVAAQKGLPSEITFDLLPETRHSFREAVEKGGLVQRTWSFLSGEVDGPGPRDDALEGSS